MAVCSRCCRRQTLRQCVAASGVPTCVNCGAPLVLDASERARQRMTESARALPTVAAERTWTRALTPVVGEPDPAAPLDLASLSASPRSGRSVRSQVASSAFRSSLGSHRRTIVIAVAVVVLAGSVGGAIAVPHMRGEIDPALVVGGVLGDLGRDAYPGYGRAAARLLGVAEGGARLRSAAAALLAGSVVAHGGGDVHRVELASSLVADVGQAGAHLLEYQIARGYLAIARGTPSAAPRLNAEQLETPIAQLYEGWRSLAEGSPLDALRAFQSAARHPEMRLVARFGAGRAREAMGARDTLAEYQRALSYHAGHFGARLGVLRTANLDPGETIEAVTALMQQHVLDAGPGEMAEAQALLARALRAEGRTAESDMALAQAAALAPTARWAAIQSAEVLSLDGKGAEATARLAPLGPELAKGTDGKLALAAAALMNHDACAAAPLLAAAAKQQPREPRVLFWLGRLAEVGERADVEAAKAYYTQALTREPRFTPALMQLSSLLVRQGKPDEALELLRRSSVSGGSHTSLQVMLGQTLLGLGQPARARDAFNAALAVSPELTEAEMGVVSSHEREGNLDAAHAYLERLLASRPDAPRARERMGDVLYALGRKDEALALYHRLLATGSATGSVSVGAARIYLDRGDADSAAPLIEPVVRREPATPGALITLGRLRWAQGDLAAALIEFGRAMAVDDSPEAHWHYGVALHAAGRDDDALAQLARATVRADALVMRGRILLGRGQPDLALQELQRAITSTTVSPEAHLLLGNAFDRLGQRDKAAGEWRTAVALSSSLPEAYYRLGRMEMDAARPAAALDSLRRAAGKPSADASWVPDLHFQLGHAELAAGSRTAAAKAFSRFLELAPRTAPARADAERALAQLR